MVRIYITPRIGTGTKEDPYRSKLRLYVDSRVSSMPYGRENLWLSAADVTAVQQGLIEVDSEIYCFPENLDTKLIAQDVSTLSAYLEAGNVPADWLNASFMFRETIRVTAAMFLYLQRISGILGPTVNFWDDVTLNTKVGGLSSEKLSTAQQAAITLGFNVDSISTNTLIRNVMKNMADQWGMRRLNLGIAGDI